MNNKGFTIIELIAAVVILALILSIGSYSVINILHNAREKNYETLIKNIKSAVETYNIECKYSVEDPSCNDEITLGDLVRYGYLNGNSKDNNQIYTIVNPIDNTSITDCIITYEDNNGKITITTPYDNDSSYSGSCPKNID